MSELYDKIVSQRGSLDNLLLKIPGFRGYVDRGDRRKADRMLRDYIAERLQERIHRLARIEKDLLDNGGMSFMSKTSSVKTKMQTYHDRVKAAAPGYSGFFEAVKVDEAALEELYSFDEAQARYINQFDTALDALAQAAGSNQGVDEAIKTLDALAVEANDAFSLREDVLTDLDKSFV
jgi:maltooligosyltrehalose synthase